MSRTKYPTLDPDFLMKCLGSCRSAEERGLVRILYMTGMHVSSLRNVKLTRMGNARRLEWTRPKTNKVPPPVEIPKDWLQDIEAFLAGRRHSRQHYLRMVQDIGQRAGYDGISPLTFRHERCVRLLEQHKYNIIVVAQLMGCSVGIVARNYGLMNPEDLAGQDSETEYPSIKDG